MKKMWGLRVWGFFAAVYVLSGLLWIPILLSGKGMTTPLNTVCMVLIACVPSLMGIIFTYLFKSPHERRDFWRRAFHWPSASLPILLAGLLIFPLLNISAYAISFHLAGREYI